MAIVRVKGRANYDGAVQKDFDVVVEISEEWKLVNFWDSACTSAIQEKYPNWSSINCKTYTKL